METSLHPHRPNRTVVSLGPLWTFILVLERVGKENAQCAAPSMSRSFSDLNLDSEDVGSLTDKS